VFEIAHKVLPLPSMPTLQICYPREIEKLNRALSDATAVTEIIRQDEGASPLHDDQQRVVSVAVDAFAISTASRFLPAEGEKNAFLVYLQPLEQVFPCTPLHLVQHTSGKATGDIEGIIDTVIASLTEHGYLVKYVCSDGHNYYNPRDRAFFQSCHPSSLEKGLDEAVRLCRGATEIPISDYLHLWKSFCSKVKNHPVSLTPDSLDNCIDSSLLEEMLRLGPPLTNRSSVGKMRDSYVITLFTF
jgi:hypothetical protein